MSTSMNDFNINVIEEFRANGGNVGGMFAEMPILLLHHTGAKSGKVRVNPLAYLADGDRYVIFASKGGAPVNPDWYHNLRAHPEVQIEVGTESLRVIATEATGEERVRAVQRAGAALAAVRRIPAEDRPADSGDHPHAHRLSASRRVSGNAADADRLIRRAGVASSGDPGRRPRTRSRTSGFATAPGSGRSSWASAVGSATARTAPSWSTPKALPRLWTSSSSSSKEGRRSPVSHRSRSSRSPSRVTSSSRSAASAPASSSCRSTRRPRTTSTCAWRWVGVMRSWAVPKGPSLDPAVKRLAIEVDDHDIAHNTFEGSTGPGTGVIVWDRGTYEQGGRVPWPEALDRGHAVFVLHGQKLRGRLRPAAHGTRRRLPSGC